MTTDTTPTGAQEAGQGAAHTPEPWAFDGWIHLSNINGQTHRYPIIWSKSAQIDVAYIVPMEDTKQADGERIVACVNACEGLNPAAVPDLLAALRLGVENDISTTEWLRIARAAIAKAEGKS